MAPIFVKQSGAWQSVTGSGSLVYPVENTFRFPRRWADRGTPDDITDDYLTVPVPTAIAVCTNWVNTDQMFIYLPATRHDGVGSDTPLTLNSPTRALGVEYALNRSEYRLVQVTGWNGWTEPVWRVYGTTVHAMHCYHHVATSSREFFLLTDRPSGETSGTQSDIWLIDTRRDASNSAVATSNALNTAPQFLCHRGDYILLNQQNSRTLYAYDTADGSYTAGQNVTLGAGILTSMRGLTFAGSASTGQFYIADYNSTDATYANKIYVADNNGTFDLTKTIYLDSSIVGTGDTVKGLDGELHNDVVRLGVLLNTGVVVELGLV